MNKQQDLASSLIDLLATRSLELPLVALVADVIAADARFNHWVALEGKRTLSHDAMLQTIDIYEDAMFKCRSEVERFTDTRDSKALAAALGEILRVLSSATRN